LKCPCLPVVSMIICLFAATMARAGDDPVSTVEAVVVTASRSERNVQELPQSVSVMSAKQIGDTPAQELDDALRLVPGIDLLGYSGEAQHPTSDSIGMRGLGGGAQGISRALVMVDGVPINDAFFGYIQWGRIPLENIERVEVVRGGGSPLWGNYAEGGVINVITREPSARQAVFDVGGGSYRTYRASGYGAYFPAGSTKLQAFASLDGTSGFQQVPDYERAPFNVPTGYRAANAQLKDTFELSGDLVGHASLNYHDNRQRLETVIDRNSQDIYTFTGDVKKRFSGGASLTATLFYSYSSFGTNNSTYFPNQANLAATTQSLNEIHDVRAHDVGGSLIWYQELSGPIANYMIGADYRSIGGVDNTDHYVAPNFSPEFTTTESHGDQTFIAGFVQATVSPITRLQLTASGRFQSLQDSDGYDGSLGGVGVVADRNDTSFDPRLDARYTIGNGLALRGAYYQSFRAPNISDQFYTFAAGGFVQLPAPFLQPEKLRGGEIGLDYLRPGLRSQFTLYRTSIDNYIVAEPTTNAVYSPAGWFVVQNENVASVLAQGFETEVNWDAGASVSASLAYTFAESVVKSNPLDPASVGQQIVDVPRNKVAAGLFYHHRQGWRLAMQAYWVSRTAWASPDHTDPGYPGRISADPHFLVDATGSYPLAKGVEIYLKLQNLFNRQYIATSFSAPSAQATGAPFEMFSGIRVTVE
jgi:outer membrane receptor protein involved in Fe transport